MAMLTIPTFSRRQFGVVAIPFGVSVLRAAAPAARWALLSDTHIPADPENVYRGFRPVENLKKVTPAIQAWKPDAALICGDLARLLGLPEDYAALRTLLSPVTDSAPVAYTLGNHDNRKNFLVAFGKQSGAQAVPNRHVLVVETGPVRCIVLDSLIETNQTPGFLGKAQRTWLGQYLQSASDMPTLVFVHHTRPTTTTAACTMRRACSTCSGRSARSRRSSSVIRTAIRSTPARGCTSSTCPRSVTTSTTVSRWVGSKAFFRAKAATSLCALAVEIWSATARLYRYSGAPNGQSRRRWNMLVFLENVHEHQTSFPCTRTPDGSGARAASIRRHTGEARRPPAMVA